MIITPPGYDAIIPEMKPFIESTSRNARMPISMGILMIL